MRWQIGGWARRRRRHAGACTGRTRPPIPPLPLLALWACAQLPGCGPGGSEDDGSRQAVEVWFHSGQKAERETIEDQVARFNSMQDTIRIRLTILPEGSYNAQVQAAALAGELPDLLEFDGPYLYNYVWQGQLIPLDGLLPPETVSDLLASIIAQGTYHGRLYGIGTFDSGLCLYGHRGRLTETGTRIPEKIEEAWTIDEMDVALAALAEEDPDGAVIDLKMNYDTLEWITYGFSPVIQSAGGDLIERTHYLTADGVLNGPASVRAMTRLQRWYASGYVDPNLDDAAFIDGDVAISWVGHWEYARYSEALGENLVVMPLPDFGHGPMTGQGSWVWGITAGSADPEAAAAFLRFLLRPEEVLMMTNANGAVPATHRAIRRSNRFGPGGPLELLVRQLETIAVPRPKTPGYPVITSAFARAFDDIRHGGDVQAALDRAVAVIDEDIGDNRGYPPR